MKEQQRPLSSNQRGDSTEKVNLFIIKEKTTLKKHPSKKKRSTKVIFEQNDTSSFRTDPSYDSQVEANR